MSPWVPGPTLFPRVSWSQSGGVSSLLFPRGPFGSVAGRAATSTKSEGWKSGLRGRSPEPTVIGSPGHCTHGSAAVETDSGRRGGGGEGGVGGAGPRADGDRVARPLYPRERRRGDGLGAAGEEVGGALGVRVA